MERSFEINDEVYFFNGVLKEGKIIAIQKDLCTVEIDKDHDFLGYFSSLYKKNRDEHDLLKDIEFEMEYLEIIRNRIKSRIKE